MPVSRSNHHIPTANLLPWTGIPNLETSTRASAIGLPCTPWAMFISANDSCQKWKHKHPQRHTYKDVCMYIYIYKYIQIYRHMRVCVYMCKCYKAVEQRSLGSRATHPLLHTPVSWPVVTHLCRKCLVQASRKACRAF